MWSKHSAHELYPQIAWFFWYILFNVYVLLLINGQMLYMHTYINEYMETYHGIFSKMCLFLQSQQSTIVFI